MLFRSPKPQDGVGFTGSEGAIPNARVATSCTEREINTHPPKTLPRTPCCGVSSSCDTPRKPRQTPQFGPPQTHRGSSRSSIRHSTGGGCDRVTFPPDFTPPPETHISTSWIPAHPSICHRGYPPPSRSPRYHRGYPPPFPHACAIDGYPPPTL